MAWIRIAAAVAVYLAIALAASALVKRRGTDIRRMEERAGSAVLVIGAVANLVVLIAVLLFVLLVDGRPLTALGLGLYGRDALFAGLAVALTVASALGFLLLLHQARSLEVELKAPPAGSAGRLLTFAAVLLVVALQEEALYRGYITVNLITSGPAVVLAISTLVFTVIHFFTNRVTPAQVASWLVGGFVLGWVYLASGSIWVPVVLHFAIDMTNVLVFGLAGELSIADLSRPLTDTNRAAYRIGHGLLIGALVVGIYGLRFATRWAG